MEFSTTKLKLNQKWPFLMVCAIAILMIGVVAVVALSTSTITKISVGTLYLEDQGGALDVQQILKLPESSWTREVNDTLSYGMPSNPYWFKFNLSAESQLNNDASNSQILEIAYALLDEIDIWFITNGELLAEYHGGDANPFSSRTLKSEKFVFPIPNVSSRLEVILRVKTSGMLLLPIRIWDEQDYIIYNGEHNLALGLFFGFLVAMALSNLFFFATTGSKMFLTYSLYVFFIGLTFATYHGIGYKYLWPDSAGMQNRSVELFAILTLLLATIFSDQLLNAKKNSGIIHRLFKISSGVIFALFVSSLILPHTIITVIFPFILFAGVFLVFFATLYLAKQGIKLARFYLVAWSALLVSGLLASLENANLINLDYSSHYLLLLGASIETILLAFALALAYGQQRDEKYQSQELALIEEQIARQAQDEALKLKEETQGELEYKVQERTLELEITLRELSDTIRELEQQTLTDALTGIRNRKHFDKKYIAEVRRSRREQTELAIVMMDIDHFKVVNDTHGHVVGDEVIKFVASTLEQNLKRTTDDACRYGGEEFALILPNTDLDGATLLAEKLREIVLQQTTKLDDVEVNVTISAGVCSSVIMPNDNENSLLDCADKALYEAKRNGRNQVVSHRLKSRDAI